MGLNILKFINWNLLLTPSLSLLPKLLLPGAQNNQDFLIKALYCWRLLFVFDTEYSRLASNSLCTWRGRTLSFWSSGLYLLSAGTSGVCYPTPGTGEQTESSEYPASILPTGLHLQPQGCLNLNYHLLMIRTEISLALQLIVIDPSFNAHNFFNRDLKANPAFGESLIRLPYEGRNPVHIS